MTNEEIYETIENRKQKIRNILSDSIWIYERKIFKS